MLCYICFNRLQLTCLLQPLELIMFANLCRRLLRTKATNNGRMLTIQSIVDATRGTIPALEVEGMLAALKDCKEKIIGGYLVVLKDGSHRFQFREAVEARVRKKIYGFVQPSSWK